MVIFLGGVGVVKFVQGGINFFAGGRSFFSD